MRVFVMKLEALLQMVKNLSMYSTNSVTVVNYTEYDKWNHYIFYTVEPQ